MKYYNKSLILFVLFFLFLSSCSSRKEKTNDLIPDEISIKYESLIVRSDSSEIFTSLKTNEFADRLVSTVLAGKIKVYEPFDTSKILSKTDLRSIIGSWQDTVMGVEQTTKDTAYIIRQFGFDKSELTKILFEENWNFNKETFSLSKKVKNWCPVKVYFKEIDSANEDTLKKMLFWVKQIASQKPEKCSVLKENIVTEFSLYNSKVPDWLADMNPRRFVNIVLNNVLSGKTPAYDFFDKKKRLSVEEIKTNLGECIKTYSVENPNTESYDTLHIQSKMDIEEIRSVIFTEDWFIDWSSLSIFKTVKSIAFVRMYENSHEGGEYEIEKKIPFIVFLNNK